MLIEHYRGKTRVMMPADHAIALEADENGNASQLYQWLLNNVRGWSYRFDAKRKDDTRPFLAITFRDESDAHLFRLKFQQPGDVMEGNGRYSRLEHDGSIRELAEKQLCDGDREKYALTFLGQVEYRQFIDKAGRKAECYSTKRNLAGYFVCWTAEEDDDDDFSIINVDASKTKRIMIERARRRHLA